MRSRSSPAGWWRNYGFDQATIVRIAREAGYTTGMVAHYFDTKQDIIIAALRLILRRIEERLTRPAGTGASRTCCGLLTEALPVDEQRYIECAFWIAFWGQVSADRRLKRINAWVHREYLRLFERCLARGWPDWAALAAGDDATRCCARSSPSSTASRPVPSPAATTGRPERQIEQLRLQLQLLHGWAATAAAAGARSSESPQDVGVRIVGGVADHIRRFRGG